MDNQRLDELHRECARYLKSRASKRIMEGLLEKYRSYGAVMGTYVLTKSTGDECDFIKGLFKKNVTAGATFRVSLRAFEAAFKGTAFEGVSLPTLLEHYFDKAIDSKKDAKEKAFREKLELLTSVCEKWENHECDKMLEDWLSKALFEPSHEAYSLVNGLYNSDRATFESLLVDLSAVLKVVQAHEDGIGIPLAAGLSTGNPHALDRGMPLRKLLQYFGAYRIGQSLPKTLQEMDALLETLNLNVDETPRLMMTYGLEAYDANGNAFGWLTFYLRNEPLNIASHNMKVVATIRAVTKHVLCCENPSTFFRAVREYPEHAAVCISGQPNLVAYKVLDKLSYAHEIRYTGDFDPEGLLIANRLKNRYSNLDLSFFSTSNYIKSLSNVSISEKRMKQLKNLNDDVLIKVALLMQEYKCAGYEERSFEKWTSN